VNFSLYSHHAESVELVLFAGKRGKEIGRTIALDPREHRTGNYWHVFVPGLRSGQIYGYHVDGPFEPERGLWFDRTKLLLDPYAKAVIDDGYDRLAAGRRGEPNVEQAMKGVVVDQTAYDWEGDRPLGLPFRGGAIYEMHVRGFTAHPSSQVRPKWRGTYAGLVEKIPYLQDLGVEMIELLPVFQFDPQSAPDGRPNYWGYEPLGFFAPHSAYSSVRSAAGPVDEFRDMVMALHRAGIEVILDVVFNHTAEDGADGPTVSLRGIDNPTYDLLDRTDRSRYVDDSGVGNTLDANHSIVRRLIIDSLRYWVEDMHVDGFRFDLASVLSRARTTSRSTTRRSCGTSTRTPCWPGRRSSPRRGTRQGSTRSVPSPGIDGRSGTARTAMSCGASSRVATPPSSDSPPPWPGARTCSVIPTEIRCATSTSSSPTTASR
jgi:glycogen operon protein